MSALPGLVNLSKLGLERCPGIHGGLVHLRGLSKLEALNINCCNCITDTDMNPLAMASPNTITFKERWSSNKGLGFVEIETLAASWGGWNSKLERVADVLKAIFYITAFEGLEKRKDTEEGIKEIARPTEVHYSDQSSNVVEPLGWCCKLDLGPSIAQCSPYATCAMSQPSAGYCSAVRAVYAQDQTSQDRRTLCTCLKQSSSSSPGVQLFSVATIPHKCGLQVSIPTNPNFNCATIN